MRGLKQIFLYSTKQEISSNKGVNEPFYKPTLKMKRNSILILKILPR